MTAIKELLDHVQARRDLPPPPMRRAIRTAAGLSLAAIGEAMEPPVTRSAVYHWEVGERLPRRRHLRQYEALLRSLQNAA